MARHIQLIFFTFLLSCVTAFAAADADSLLTRADSLREEYMFEESIGLYDEALSLCRDSAERISILDRRMLSENGLGMRDFVLHPTVVARHRFSLDEFFLYYPLEDRSWRTVPNQLDTSGTHSIYKAVYVPEGSTSVYFSAPDQGGSMNIYRTEKKDSLWSVPCLLNEYLVSSGDEIYPMLSPDGKRLFFASSGLYGMGGFDLYVSTWNEETQEWGPPSNMGMPYSSPFNDYLFIDTPDGKYSIFASDRNCPGDSVDVYVLEQESMPVRKSVGDIAALKALMSLEPEDDLSSFDNSMAVSQSMPEDADTRKYTDKVTEVRALRDSIGSYTSAIEEKRAELAQSDDAGERALLTQEILKAESSLPVFQDSLERASALLQQIEMEFLFKGIVLDMDKLINEADREVEGASSNYVFARMNPGGPLSLEMEQPEVEFDYTFMILPEGRFAEDNAVPDGIVYQIQIFSLSSRASVKDLRGLSPVFEEKNQSGNYVYRVGVFNRYNDVLSNLNKVKKAGFRTAFIVAFENGRPIQVSKARSLESRIRTVPVFQIAIVPDDGMLPDAVIEAVSSLCGKKDIAKTEKNGKITYIVGPFDDSELVRKVEEAVRAAGMEEVSSSQIGVKEVDLSE